VTLIEILAVVGAVVGPVVAAASGAYTIYIGRLRDRDKLEHDTARAADAHHIESLELRVANCENDCRASRELATADREKREVAEVRAAKLEGENSSLVHLCAELRSENRELRDRLFGGKS
jgi:hypothetical protein